MKKRTLFAFNQEVIKVKVDTQPCKMQNNSFNPGKPVLQKALQDLECVFFYFSVLHTGRLQHKSQNKV